MRITLIHNPKAGYHGITRDDVVRMVREAGYEPAVISSKSATIDSALENPGELVVVAGGDGTVGSVALKLAGRDVPLAILPLGTANNLATALGITGSIESMVKCWKTARPRAVDVGTAKGRWGEIRFLESFGLGLFAMTMRNIEPMHDTSQQKFETREEEFQHAYREMKKIIERTAPREYGLEIDGVESSGKYVLVEAMNIACIGPNLFLDPNADPGDGKLDVVLVSESDCDSLCEYLSRRIQGEPSAPDLEVRRASRVVIDPKGASLHIDDELHSESHEPLEPAGPIELATGSDQVRFLLP